MFTAPPKAVVRNNLNSAGATLDYFSVTFRWRWIDMCWTPLGGRGKIISGIAVFDREKEQGCFGGSSEGVKGRKGAQGGAGVSTEGAPNQGSNGGVCELEPAPVPWGWNVACFRSAWVQLPAVCQVCCLTIITWITPAGLFRSECLRGLF